MGLTGLFKSTASALNNKNAQGAFLIAAGAAVAAVDCARLSSGAGLSGEWIAAGSAMIMGGLQRIQSKLKHEFKLVPIR